MWFGATSLRMRYVPATIMTVVIIVTEEVLLNIGTSSPEPWDLVSQIYAILLVVVGVYQRLTQSKFFTEKCMFWHEWMACLEKQS